MTSRLPASSMQRVQRKPLRLLIPAVLCAPVAWVEKLLRGTRVWMQSDEAGQPITGPDERVEIVYKPGGKPYRASVHNLDAVADARPVTDEALVAQSSPGPREKRSSAATAGTAAGAR